MTRRGGNPSEPFASGVAQSVESLTEHQARIVVEVVPSDQHGNVVRQTEGPTSEDLRPSGLINSRDPTVVATVLSTLFYWPGYVVHEASLPGQS